MNIAITATGPTLQSPVAASFAQAPYLLIVEAESTHFTAIAHTMAPGSDEPLARAILAHNCEAVITGALSPAAFAILADAMVTRFRAGDLTAGEALTAMDNRRLEMIRNANGASSCSGDHHHH